MTDNKFRIYIDTGQLHISVPVLPQEVTVSCSADNKTYNVLDIGEIIVPGNRDLKKVSFRSYFPGNSNDPLISGKPYEKPSYYIEEIENAMDAGSTVNLTVARYDAGGNRLYDTNIKAVVEEFKVTDKGGEPVDVYYDISFREYRDYSPVQVILPIQGFGAQIQEEKQRPVGKGKLYVGAKVIANGTYYASSYGDKPTGKANNLQTTVSRIISESSRPYPVLIGGGRGWITEGQLQVTG